MTTINCGTPTANLLSVKLLFNSIISTPGTRFKGLDLNNFYLNIPMDCSEFLCLKLDNFLEDVVKQYELQEKVDAKDFVMIQVEKGMYGLPYAES